MTPEELSKAFGDLAQSNQTVALVVLILANLATGVLSALRDGKFTLAEFGSILKKALPFFGSYLALGTTGNLMGGGIGEVLNWAVTLAAGAPFAVGTTKETASLMNMKLPDPVANMVLPRASVWASKGNDIFRRYQAGKLTLEAARAEVAALETEFPDFPKFPPGYPGSPV